MSPRGRRPGGVDTRQAIVEAARVDFAEQGYDGTSLRGIARRAEVDPALVHHYFGGKPQLFAAVMDIPADPAALIGAVVSGPRDQVGESLVRTFLAVWDSEAGRQRFQALVRAAVSHDDATRMLREFLTREVFGRVVRELATDGAPSAGMELRAGLAAAQMVGLAMMRYIVEFPAVVDATHDELAALVGPTIQRYLVP
ncbi:TetR family transcriptional regulator [Pedococcus bigeumensis]|jgi:AcrR family transcriptional regulator|uniref:TetR/AcrR family transcriptional regulator n=1 Tax=Pedococcus bigeumensis TaxID=433644 RepID=UPI002FE97137